MKKTLLKQLSIFFGQIQEFSSVTATAIHKKAIHSDVRGGLFTNSPLKTSDVKFPDLKSPSLEFHGSDFDFPCLNRRCVLYAYH